MDFAIVSPFLGLVDAFKRPTDSSPASSAESSPRPEFWLLCVPERSVSHERAPQGSVAGGAPEPVTPPGAKFVPGVFCPELSGLPCGGEITL
jgi:hypothetical protein